MDQFRHSQRPYHDRSGRLTQNPSTLSEDCKRLSPTPEPEEQSRTPTRQTSVPDRASSAEKSIHRGSLSKRNISDTSTATASSSSFSQIATPQAISGANNVDTVNLQRKPSRAQILRKSLSPEQPFVPFSAPPAQVTSEKIRQSLFRKVRDAPKRVDFYPEIINGQWFGRPQPPQGYIYGLTDTEHPGYIKIGFSETSVDHRVQAMEQNCKRKLTVAIEERVIHPKLVEDLIHLELKSSQHLGYCECKTVHREWFKVDKARAKRVTERWCNFMNRHKDIYLVDADKSEWLWFYNKKAVDKDLRALLDEVESEICHEDAVSNFGASRCGSELHGTDVQTSVRSRKAVPATAEEGPGYDITDDEPGEAGISPEECTRSHCSGDCPPDNRSISGLGETCYEPAQRKHLEPGDEFRPEQVSGTKERALLQNQNYRNAQIDQSDLSDNFRDSNLDFGESSALGFQQLSLDPSLLESPMVQCVRGSQAKNKQLYRLPSATGLGEIEGISFRNAKYKVRHSASSESLDQRGLECSTVGSAAGSGRGLATLPLTTHDPPSWKLNFPFSFAFKVGAFYDYLFSSTGVSSQ